MNNFATTSLPPGQGLTKGSPVHALQHFCNNQVTGLLQLFSAEVCWIIRLESGKITYVRHSVEPFDHLICHLRSMSHDVPSLTKEFRAQVCAMFEDDDSTKDEDPYRCREYEALCWLLNQSINVKSMALIVENMSKEAIEPLFWLEEVSYRFSDRPADNSSPLCQMELGALIAHCQQRFKLWQLLSPQIWSPFQRPYYFGRSLKQQELLPELNLQEKFSTILKGFSFRHLSVLTRQDELRIAGGLLPYIYEEVVVLRDPQPPFDKLPRVPQKLPQPLQELETSLLIQKEPTKTSKESLKEIKVEEATYTIACVDDSPTVLAEIGRILNASNLKFVAINDSLKAPMQILKLKPDLILLDVNMPKVDGYKLCRLLKNNPALKNTPIVMVTGNSGIIDRAKAKIAGSADFLSKPFTQEGLLKMVFRHLS